MEKIPNNMFDNGPLCNDDELCFEDGDDFSEEENINDEKDNCWKILVVDDEDEIHTVTQLALSDFTFEGKKLKFINAYSGKEAKALIAKHPDTALVFLDVIMETDDAGLDVVKYIRQTLRNSIMQIVLRTGQPGKVPEVQIVFKYEINDFKAKTELTRVKLQTKVVVSLREFQLLKKIMKDSSSTEDSHDRIKILEQTVDDLKEQISNMLADGKGYQNE
jgi:CheY-like chemotaxis protein